MAFGCGHGRVLSEDGTMELTRRELLKRGIAGTTVLGLYGLRSDSLARALAMSPKCGQLTDIEHVVILIQENRSFDHYFGTYRGVRGFSDQSLAFHQPDPANTTISPVG